MKNGWIVAGAALIALATGAVGAVSATASEAPGAVYAADDTAVVPVRMSASAIAVPPSAKRKLKAQYQITTYYCV